MQEGNELWASNHNHVRNKRAIWPGIDDEKISIDQSMHVRAQGDAVGDVLGAVCWLVIVHVKFVDKEPLVLRFQDQVCIVVACD